MFYKWCFVMFVDVYLLMFTDVIGVRWCLLKFIDVYWYLLMLTDVYWMYFGVADWTRYDKIPGPSAFAHWCPLGSMVWSSSWQGYKPGEPEIKFADVKKHGTPVGAELADCFGEVPAAGGVWNMFAIILRF